MEIYSTGYNSDGELCVFVGNTSISGVPTLEDADLFITLAKHRGITNPELIFDDQGARRLNLIGAMLIEELLCDLHKEGEA